MITTKLMVTIAVTTLAILLAFSVSGKVLAEEDFMNEEDTVDDQTDAQRNADATEKESATSFDFNNGDKGCDTNHHYCQHVANDGNNKKSSNETPMTKLINKLPNGCMVVKGPTTTERVAGIRTTVEITCEG
jgi:hypothetical protein